MMFQKKRFFENKKNQSEIFNCGLPCQVRQAKKTSSPLKIIEVTHSRSSGRGHGTGVLIADRRRKSPLDRATDFLVTI